MDNKVEARIKELEAIMEGMDDEEKRDMYRLADLALSQVESAEDCIDKIFGDHSLFTLRLLSNMLSGLMSKAEIADNARNAKMEPQRISAVPLDKVDDYVREKSDSVIPLLAIRIEKKMTQKELAKLSGVNIRQIARIESGESKAQNVTVGNMVALADALGVDIHELLK